MKFPKCSPLYSVRCSAYSLKILSWDNSLIANNNIRSVILEIKTTNVKSLKYYMKLLMLLFTMVYIQIPIKGAGILSNF